jgi:uncharacterized membrane protein
MDAAEEPTGMYSWRVRESMFGGSGAAEERLREHGSLPQAWGIASMARSCGCGLGFAQINALWLHAWQNGVLPWKPRMNKLYTAALALLAMVLLTACGDQPEAVQDAPPPEPVVEVSAWDRFVDQQIEAYLLAHPAWAVTQGRHEFDGRLPDWSEAGIKAEIARLKAARAAARALDGSQFSAEQRYQREYFIARIDHDLFWLEKANWPFRNPQFYFGWMSDSLDPSPYITLDYAPIEQRMQAFITYQQNLLEAAKQIRNNLRIPMPLPWVELGAAAFGGYAAYFRDEVPQVWASVEDPELQAAFAESNAAAIVAMQSLADWLASSRNIADANYALGAGLFSEMLWDTERVNISLEELEAIGRADMERNLQSLRLACAEFAPGLGLGECMQKMSDRKPEVSSVAAAREQLVELKAFLVAQDLVTIPGDEAALVNEAPPYARSNFAYISIPGPWEENQPSVYYISPPNPDWPEQVQADYIAGESDLLFTSVHEVWPGHFLNFMHANRAPWEFGRAFVNYAYGEGWAHYTEEMMLEAGLRGADAETRIGQLSNALLRNARFLSAIGLHTQGWSLEEAQRFFMEEAYQGEGTALQQAARGTYDPAYLNYTMGKLLIKQLREDWTASRGGREAWRDFHDRFLSFGGPPIPLVRQQMMAESQPLAVFPQPQPDLKVVTRTTEPQLNWAWDCEDGRRVVTSFAGEEMWLFLPEETVQLGQVRTASGAAFAAGDIQFWSKGDEATLDEGGQRTVCTVNRQASIWEDAKLRGADFRGQGNEPGWQLELFSGRPSLLVTDYGEKRFEFQAGAPAPLENGEGSVFSGRSGDTEIVVTLTSGPCQDSMADVSYETTVLVQLGEQQLQGCGNALH